MLAAVIWDGGGGNLLWSDPLNWDGPVADQLPGADDDVTINAAGSVAINYDLNIATSIKSLTLSDSLAVTRGALTIETSFSIGASNSVTTDGTGVSFASLGATTIDGADFYARGGSVISLPSVTAATNIGDTVWEASGIGSQVLLPNLTSFGTGHSINQDVYVNALGGGVVDLSALTQITDTQTGDLRYRSVRIKAQGDDSVVRLNSLQLLEDRSAGDIDHNDAYNGAYPFTNESSRLEALNQGTIELGA
ncbi:MAG: hypothetical protein JNL18_22580, partial [Planctomycetaceae bacterium]|nr:hypothetical protein [Planctomycetaceae bacterium]